MIDAVCRDGQNYIRSAILKSKSSENTVLKTIIKSLRNDDLRIKSTKSLYFGWFQNTCKVSYLFEYMCSQWIKQYISHLPSQAIFEYA